MTFLRSIASFALGATLAVAAAVPAAAQSAPAPIQYFPLPVASRWLAWDYQIAPNGPVRIAIRPATIRADRIVSSNVSVAKAKLTGYLGDPTHVAWVTRDARGSVFEAAAPPPSARPAIFRWYDFGAAAGVDFDSGLQRNLFPGVNVTAQNGGPVCVVTPAGIFRDCRRVYYQAPGVADAGITTETFAPGIGLVARSEATSWGSFETRLTNLRTSTGFALVGRRPLTTDVAVTPDQLVVGGARPPAGAPPRRYVFTATAHVSAARATAVIEGRAPVTFYAISESGHLFAKLDARRAGIRQIGPRGIDYSVTFDVTSVPIGHFKVAAEVNMVPGAAPATADVEVLAAP